MSLVATDLGVNTLYASYSVSTIHEPGLDPVGVVMVRQNGTVDAIHYEPAGAPTPHGTGIITLSYNSAGEAVGVRTAYGQSSTFHYLSGVYTDVNDLLAPGTLFRVVLPTAIDAAGAITAIGYDPIGRYHNLTLATPAPPP